MNKYAGIRAWVTCPNCGHEFFTTNIAGLMELFFRTDPPYGCKSCSEPLDIRTLTVCSINGADYRCDACKYRFRCYSNR
jgi:hypothetical protein